MLCKKLWHARGAETVDFDILIDIFKQISLFAADNSFGL